MQNAKLRLKNPMYWGGLILTILVGVGGQLSINFEELNTWAKVGQLLIDIVSNPYMLFIVVVNAIVIGVNYSTNGISDEDKKKQLEAITTPKNEQFSTSVFVEEEQNNGGSNYYGSKQNENTSTEISR